MLPEGGPDPRRSLVVSVDCALLPTGAAGLPLPGDGHLLFFADPDLDFRGQRNDAVCYVPAGAPTAVRHVATTYEPFPSQDMRTM
ncbi:hypothetical protein [Streptomyces brasiliensis]|uniref:Uncharacterized protein n=1 Tax=Streptomyces brasiliensis TaxID=1954 RepID=A0A917L2S2_9ACTN|nr:hypothetical protein [Streptomyces brasiliensis]GGJ39669.1 hypothetical protein GCM10010121_058490 [Streptomyces brasiliensis]